MSSRVYAWVATALFAVVAAVVIIHAASGDVYPGYTRAFSVVLDVVVAVFSVAALVAGMVHRSWAALSVMLAGCLATVAYGFLFTVASRAVGVPIVFAAGAQLFCVVHAASGFFEPERDRAHRPRLLDGALRRLHVRHSHG